MQGGSTLLRDDRDRPTTGRCQLLGFVPRGDEHNRGVVWNFVQPQIAYQTPLALDRPVDHYAFASLRLAFLEEWPLVNGQFLPQRTVAVMHGARAVLLQRWRLSLP